MLSYKSFEAALGKNVQSVEVIELLKKIGYNKPLRLSGELDVYINFPKEGFILVFGLPDSTVRDWKALNLDEVQLYDKSPANGIKQPFAGELPGKLIFLDRQMDVHKKLGKPDKAKKMFRLDTWEMKPFYVSVNYKKASKGETQSEMGIDAIQYGVSKI